MRSFDVAARFLALGSLVLVALACPAMAAAAVADTSVIAQASDDLKPSPVDTPPIDTSGEHGDADSETDDAPDPVPPDATRLWVRADTGATTLLACLRDGERPAKRRALERPPRRHTR